MPSNKDAFVRYRAINRCLLGGRFIPLDELIHNCEEATGIRPISKRTIQKDLEDMRNDSGLGFFAPISYDRLRKGYFYETEGYSIDNIPLHEKEVQALNNALSLLGQYKGSGIFGQVSDAIGKLLGKVKIGMMHPQSSLDAFMESESGNTEGIVFLEPCIEAIREKYVLVVTYQKYNQGNPKEHVVHPCYLREYRNRWYLIGWHQKHETFSIFALDRITSLKPDFSVTFQSPDFEVADYFKHVIGMSAPSVPPQLVRFSVALSELPFLMSQPIHHSLKLEKEENERAILTLFVIINYELKQFILGLGSQIQVLEPASLSAEISQSLRNAANQY